MKLRFLFLVPFAVLILTASASAQICINAGGGALPPDAGAGAGVGCALVADQNFTGGAVWGPANDPVMGTLPGSLQTLRYGTRFSYAFPCSTGLTSVSILMLEPNKTTLNQRMFTVTVNGQQSAPLDLFALTGNKLIPYEADYLVQCEKVLTISFQATVGNAVVSQITIRGQIGSNPIAGGGGISCRPTSGSGYVLRAETANGVCLAVRVWGDRGPLAQRPQKNPDVWWPTGDETPKELSLGTDCRGYWTEPGIPCIYVAKNQGGTGSGNGISGITYVPVGIEVAP